MTRSPGARTTRKRPDGTWKPLKTYKTKGSKETRTINLPKGNTSVVVGAKDGYVQTTSAPIYLKDSDRRFPPGGEPTPANPLEPCRRSHHAAASSCGAVGYCS